MEKIRKITFIDAPPSKVFSYLLDPSHLPEIWPSMVETANVKTKPDGTPQSYDWTYKMAGLKFHGHCELVEVQRDRVIAFENASGIPSKFRWTFEPRDKGTDYIADVEYEIPGVLLGRLAAPFLKRLNEREADAMAQNTKERLEAQTAG